MTNYRIIATTIVLSIHMCLGKLQPKYNPVYHENVQGPADKPIEATTVFPVNPYVFSAEDLDVLQNAGSLQQALSIVSYEPQKIEQKKMKNKSPRDVKNSTFDLQERDLGNHSALKPAVTKSSYPEPIDNVRLLGYGSPSKILSTSPPLHSALRKSAIDLRDSKGKMKFITTVSHGNEQKINETYKEKVSLPKTKKTRRKMQRSQPKLEQYLNQQPQNTILLLKKDKMPRPFALNTDSNSAAQHLTYATFTPSIKQNVDDPSTLIEQPFSTRHTAPIGSSIPSTEINSTVRLEPTDVPTTYNQIFVHTASSKEPDHSAPYSAFENEHVDEVSFTDLPEDDWNLSPRPEQKYDYSPAEQLSSRSDDSAKASATSVIRSQEPLIYRSPIRSEQYVDRQNSFQEQEPSSIYPTFSSQNQYRLIEQPTTHRVPKRGHQSVTRPTLSEKRKPTPEYGTTSKQRKEQYNVSPNSEQTYTDPNVVTSRELPKQEPTVSSRGEQLLLYRINNPVYSVKDQKSPTDQRTAHSTIPYSNILTRKRKVQNLQFEPDVPAHSGERNFGQQIIVQPTYVTRNFHTTRQDNMIDKQNDNHNKNEQYESLPKSAFREGNHTYEVTEKMPDNSQQPVAQQTRIYTVPHRTIFKDVEPSYVENQVQYTSPQPTVEPSYVQNQVQYTSPQATEQELAYDQTRGQNVRMTKVEYQPVHQPEGHMEDQVEEADHHKEHHKPKEEHEDEEEEGSDEHYEGEHHEDGEHGEEGYKEFYEHDSGEKGHHDKESHDQHYEEKEGKDKEHSEEAGYHKEYEKGEEGEKKSGYNEKGHYKKGHSTKGEHVIHKKDEFDKKTDFFDEFHDGGDSEKEGGYHEEYEHHKGGHYKKGHHQQGSEEAHHGEKGRHEKGHHHHEKKGHDEHEGHEHHHHNEHKHGKKGGNEHSKHWHHKKGDDR